MSSRRSPLMFVRAYVRSKHSSGMPSPSSGRNLSSKVLQLRMDVSVSVPFCKRAPRALYALTNSHRSAPFLDSRALKRMPTIFAFSDLY